MPEQAGSAYTISVNPWPGGSMPQHSVLALRTITSRSSMAQTVQPTSNISHQAAPIRGLLEMVRGVRSGKAGSSAPLHGQDWPPPWP